MFDSIPLILAQNQTDSPPPREPTDAADTGDQAGQNGGGDAGQQQQQQGAGGQQPRGLFGDSGFMIMMLLMLGVFFFIMISGQRREKKKRAQVLQSLKKGAKVQTIGGIRGTIVEIRDNEVIVKVDENSNTRIRISREAVQGVIEDKGEKEEG